MEILKSEMKRAIYIEWNRVDIPIQNIKIYFNSTEIGTIPVLIDWHKENELKIVVNGEIVTDRITSLPNYKEINWNGLINNFYIKDETRVSYE